MKRRMWLAAGVAAVAGTGGALLASRWRSLSSIGPIEADVWSRRFDKPSGGELSLIAFRGRPVLLNFWATWCPPCVREMPMLDEFHKSHPGLQIVGLAVDGPTPVREFLSRVPVSFPIGLAGLDGAELGRTLGNTSGGLPFSTLFDRTGRLHDRKLGAMTSSDLEKWSREL